MYDPSWTNSFNFSGGLKIPTIRKEKDEKKNEASRNDP
jgi:hypothetical protein